MDQTHLAALAERFHTIDRQLTACMMRGLVPHHVTDAKGFCMALMDEQEAILALAGDEREMIFLPRHVASRNAEPSRELIDLALIKLDTAGRPPPP